MTGPGDQHAAEAADVVAELRLLAESVLERLGPWLAAAAQPQPAPGAGAPGSSCGWCPLCAVAAALRGERPELARRLAEQGSGAVAALRTVLDAHTPESHVPGPAPSTAQPTAPAGPTAPAEPAVQRIPVRRRAGAS